MSERKTIDLTGMRCPGPIVQLNAEIRQITQGAELEALSDDPAFELDAKAWCRRTGHELLALASADGIVRARIRRRA
ncbi:MAG: sulfurtransferase TusA family protein [Burkholderiales bacterium]|nr:sulfurtransferase TusA family protein [Burkholderiales bacterium]